MKRLRTLRGALHDGMKALDEVLRLAGAMSDDDADDDESAADDERASTKSHEQRELQRATVQQLRHLYSFT